MNASYEWLRAFVPVDATPAQLRELITLHTATVEELVPLRTDLAPIVVGRVVEAGHHPDSDHLWVTKVDAGGELLEVVCGAPNVTVGKLYPFAPVGTTMPNGMKLDRRKIRGVVSNGMLCSARELGLGDDHQGILELETTAAPGTPFLSVMPVGDTRLVIDVGANRADLQSHIGIARELSAITGKKWQLPTIPNLPAAIPAGKTTSGKGTTGGFTVSVEENTRTRRYMAAVMTGVKIAPSPEWLVRRLEAVGVRAINNVVDATNYVLHELGQPIHAFDAAKLAGKTVIVRKAKSGEKLTTLDGTERILPADSVVIADGKHAQAVAGVMGGRDSEITNDSRDLFIEVAAFDPKLTRTARKALGMSTDASYRFERGVDPEIGPVAMDRVVRLIQSLAGGQLADTAADVSSAKTSRPEIILRGKRITQIIGIEIPLAKAAEYLEHAGFEIAGKKTDSLTVRVPSWRTDVLGEVDLVEEVARFHGYDRVPSEIRPFRPTSTVDDHLWTLSNRIRDTMVALGFLEVRPMPFVAGSDDTHVRVATPLAENEAHLRTSLLETLARRTEFNLSHRTGDIRLFEIGSAFYPGGGGIPREQVRLGVVMTGRRRPPHFSEPTPPLIDEWDAKAVAERAAQTLARSVGREGVSFESGEDSVLWKVVIGDDREHAGDVVRLNVDAPVWAGPVYGIELVLDAILTDPPAARGKHTYIEVPKGSHKVVSKYRAIPTMPPAEFDLALLVPAGTTVADVERVVRAAAGELLERLDLFDQYTGAGVEEGHRSLAWRLTFRHAERTLRDKEIEGRRNKILSALQQELHVRQRTG